MIKKEWETNALEAAQDEDLGVDDSQSVPGSIVDEEYRDEVEEIHRQAKEDNSRVCLGRTLATGALLATAIAVTWSTYVVLKKEEQEDFEMAVSSLRDEKLS